MISEKTGEVKVSRLVLLRVTAMIAALAVLFAANAFAAEGERYIADIYDGSHITRVETLSDNAYTVVKEAGIELSENDKLLLDDFVPGEESVIVICRESQVTFIFPDGTEKQVSFAGTAGELIREMGITLGEDLVSSVSENAVVTDKMTVRVLNSYGLTINADGETKTVKSTAETVGDLLKEQGIVLDSDDEASPSADTKLTNGMAVDVLRVEYTEREAVEAIPFTTKTVNSSTLAKGTVKVTTEGQNGEKKVVYRDKIVNGELAGTSVVSETVTKEPVAEVKTVGTFTASSGLGNKKIVKNGAPISELALPSKYSIDGNNVPTSYKKVITGKAAAYCIPGGTTATGKKVKPGYIAVNPKQIPYGTEMWIVSDDGVVYGYAIAADTGGFAKKNTFVVDLYMSSKNQCYQWGARNVKIYVL